MSLWPTSPPPIEESSSPFSTLARRKGPYVVPALVFLAVVLAMFWRLWTPISGAQRTFGWDAQWEYWGDLKFQLDAYRDGTLPLWNPFDRTGYPFHADPQAGVLYPVTWLLLAVGALAGDADYWIVAVKIVFHFWLAALGMYAFLRRRKLPSWAAYAGGLIQILTYPFIHNLFSALNWTAAWCPWMLLAVDAWAEKPSLRRGLLVSLTTAMGFLAGAPAAFWYLLLVVVPYATWAIIHNAKGRFVPFVHSGAVAALVFLLIVLAQLDATGTLVANSVRTERNLEFIGMTAFTPEDLMSFVIPRFPAPSENCYMGIAAIVWAISALTIRPSARKLVLGGIAVFGVLCAWGDIGMFLPISASIAAPFSWFRRAHRYLYVTTPPLAILAAEGLALLASLSFEDARKRIGRIVLGAGAVGMVVFGVGFVITMRDASRPEPLRDAYALGFAATFLATWLTRQVVAKDGSWRRAFAVIAVVALGLDLWFSRSFVLDRNMHSIPDTTRDREVPVLSGIPLEARIYDREYLKFRPGVRLHVRDLGGYEDDPLALTRYASFLGEARKAPRLLALANVRYLFEAGRKITPKSRADTDALVPLRKGVFELKAPAPAVYWVDSAQVADAPEAALAMLLLDQPGQAAILEKATLKDDERERATTGALPPRAGKIVSLERNRVEVEISAPGDGLVVVSEGFFPGWTATVDGQPTRVLPVNGLFRAIFAGPGDHRIVMRYAGTRYLALAAVELATFLLLAIALISRRSSQIDAGRASP